MHASHRILKVQFQEQYNPTSSDQVRQYLIHLSEPYSIHLKRQKSSTTCTHGRLGLGYVNGDQKPIRMDTSQGRTLYVPVR